MARPDVPAIVRAAALRFGWAFTTSRRGVPMAHRQALDTGRRRWASFVYFQRSGTWRVFVDGQRLGDAATVDDMAPLVAEAQRRICGTLEAVFGV